MFKQNIQYQINGKINTKEPVVVLVHPKATAEGKISLPGTASVFSARVNKVAKYEDKYDVCGPDIFSDSLCGYTGLDDAVIFVFDPSQIGAPTGAIHGEKYGLKFVGTETGMPNHRYVADVIFEVSDNIKG